MRKLKISPGLEEQVRRFVTNHQSILSDFGDRINMLQHHPWPSTSNVYFKVKGALLYRPEFHVRRAPSFKNERKIARKKDGTERVRKPVRLNGAALVYLPTWMWQGFWVVRIINRAGRWHLALDRTDWFTFITMNAGAVNCLIAPVSMLVSMSTSNDNQNRCCIRISPLHHPICNKSYFCSTSLMAVFSSTAADVHSWKVTYNTRQWLLVTRVSLTTVRVTWTAKGDLVQLWVRRALKFAKSGQHRKTVRSDVVADKMSTFYARFTVYVFCQKCDFWHGLIHGEQSGIERGG